jgi:hypothetical protein
MQTKKGMRSAVSHSNVEKNLIYSPVNHTPLQWRWEEMHKEIAFFSPSGRLLKYICGFPTHPFFSFSSCIFCAMENEGAIIP